MSGTLVCFHAHPDDEAIITGGTIARAARDGHRVVVVFATRGELGEVDDGVLDARRKRWATVARSKSQRAADVLGVARVEFLGYTDSGMAGEDTNAAHGAFAGRRRRGRGRAARRHPPRRGRRRCSPPTTSAAVTGTPIT